MTSRDTEAQAGGEVEASPVEVPEPIAVVGLGCRFPGAPDLAAYWDLLGAGRSAVKEVPSDRWAVDSLYDADIMAPGKMVTRWGGFIDHVDQFDPSFFGLSPREAAWMDPQQRLLLEVAWEAMECGGIVADAWRGRSVGVFVGLSANDFTRRAEGYELIDAYAGTGNALSIAANRLSYLLDLRGPSMVVDTACSSALVATHLACRSIWTGESEAALVGGANMILSPEITIAFTKAGMMSPRGRCSAFSAGADGYVRAEGVGVVVLKPMGAALADGDHVYAQILGTAVNQDGRSNGMTAPSATAQEAVIRSACHSAGIAPSNVDYVEAHGTGTPIGDPIEAKALGRALAHGRSPSRPCAIGSVKTNFGHMEAAAGIASLIKVCLALEHDQIPPSLNFDEPNPLIPFDQLPLRVQQHLGPWPDTDGRPPIAGINSFGFGGANAHVVLAGAPDRASADLTDTPNPACADRARLLVISAHSPAALQALAQSYAKMLESSPSVNLDDVCYTAAQRRSHLEHRAAVVASTADELRTRLGALSEGLPANGVITGKPIAGRVPSIAYVCSGQGTQWWAMGRRLMESAPTFRLAVEECDAAFRAHTDWSIIDELMAAESASRLDETERAQPALFAIQVALAEMWTSWGLAPDAVVGHSLGEVAAARIAGVLDLEDAVSVVFHRSRLMQGATGNGRMAVVSMPCEEIDGLLRDLDGRVAVAAINSATSTVVAGATDAVEELVESLEAAGVGARYLPVNYAFHSPQVYGYEAELRDSLVHLRPRDARHPIYSTVTGKLAHGPEFGAGYWAANLHGPVNFFDAVGNMVVAGYDAFIELSPDPALVGAVSVALRHHDRDGTSLASLRRDEDDLAVLLEGVGRLFAVGRPPNWPAVAGPNGRVVRLPTMAWQRSRHWPEVDDSAGAVGRIAAVVSHPHPVVQRRLEAPNPTWEGDLGGGQLAYLADHRVEGSPVAPATMYVEMALAAGQELLAPGSKAVRDVEFTNVLALEGDGQVVRVEVRADGAGGRFEIFSRRSTAPSLSEWRQCATGSVRTVAGAAESSPGLDDVTAAIGRCPEQVAGDDFYTAMARAGLDYGASFRGVETLWRGPGEVVARLTVPDGLDLDERPAADDRAGDQPDGGYTAHPALLDISGQPTLALLDSWPRLYLPVGFGALRVHGPLSAMRWAHARLRSLPEQGSTVFEVDGATYDEDGNVLVELEGGRMQLLESSGAAPASSLDDWVYSVEWRDSPLPSTPVSSDGRPWLVLADETGLADGVVAALAEQGEPCVVVRHGDRSPPNGDAVHIVDPRDVAGFESLLRRVTDDLGAPRGIVDMWNLDIPHPDADGDFELAIDLGATALTTIVQAATALAWPEPPRLWVITSGAQPIVGEPGPVAVGQAPSWGFTKTLAYEHSELRPTLVDVDTTADAAADLVAELLTDSPDDQVRVRGGERQVARLAQIRGTDVQTMMVPARSGGPYRLDITTPGIIDNLILRDAPRRPPDAGEVEIAVQCAGLNFRDVMKSLGIYPSPEGDVLWLGDECAGVVTAVGAGVAELAVGDEVYGIAPASFGSHATTSARFVVLKPERISFDQAASVPVAFLTAYYSLHHVARVRPNERVLIHAATGGVGLAAIQVARWLGAEIFATAGNDDKRDYLRSLGIEHVMDSRSPAFAAEVMEATGGQGVDVVLNSLSGELLTKSLEALGPYGRFVEIGKRDIYMNSRIGLQPFKHSLSFFAVDLDSLFRDQPELAGAMLEQVAERIDNADFLPLPTTVIAATEAATGFKQMAQAAHMGKIVLAFDAPASGSAAADPVIRDDATYLITGGLGGLGLSVANWLTRQGARHIALMGRGEARDDVAHLLHELEATGADVRVLRADVASADAVDRAFAELAATMPPVRGVVHAAGVLDDARVLELDAAKIGDVMAPKMIGGWNLHRASATSPLDFFLLFSSAAALLGSPGQANYAAANAFLDGLAQHRSREGLPAMSIAWGPWADVGMAARRGSSAVLDGVGRIDPDQGLAFLGRALPIELPSFGVVPIDWNSWFDAYAMTARMPFFGDFSSGLRSDGSSELRAALLAAADDDARIAMLTAHLQDELARVLQLGVDHLPEDRPLNTLGVDSLMGIEFKNRIDRELSITLPMVTLVQGPTISQMATLLLRLVEESEQDESASLSASLIATAATDFDSARAQIDDLADEEVDELLAKFLDDVASIDPQHRED